MAFRDPMANSVCLVSSCGLHRRLFNLCTIIIFSRNHKVSVSFNKPARLQYRLTRYLSLPPAVQVASIPSPGLPGLDNREPLTITSEVTPRSHTGDPKILPTLRRSKSSPNESTKDCFTVPLPHLNSVVHGPRVCLLLGPYLRHCADFWSFF